MTQGKWTDPEIERLTALWNQDDPRLSARQIAAVMQRTKNEIVGKAHRLKLSARPSPIGTSGPDHPNWRDGRQSKARPPRGGVAAVDAARRLAARAAPGPVARPAPVALVPAKAGTASVHRQCQWITGEPAGARSAFCCAPVLRGSSYCAEHHARCWHKRIAA